MFITDEELVSAVREAAHGDTYGTDLVYEIVRAMEMARNTEAVTLAIQGFVPPKMMDRAQSMYLVLGNADFQMRYGLPSEKTYEGVKALVKHLASRKVPQCMEVALLKSWAITFDGDTSPLNDLDFLMVDEIEEVSWLVPYNGTCGVKCLHDAPEHVIEYVPSGRAVAVDRSRLTRVPAAWRLKVLSERTNQIVEFIWLRTPNSRLTVPQLVRAGSVAKPSELIAKFPFTRVNDLTATLLSNGHVIGGAACLLLGCVHLGIGNGPELVREMHRHLESDRGEVRGIDDKLKVSAESFFPYLFERQIEAQTKPLARVIEHWRLGLR